MKFEKTKRSALCTQPKSRTQHKSHTKRFCLLFFCSFVSSKLCFFLALFIRQDVKSTKVTFFFFLSLTLSDSLTFFVTLCFSMASKLNAIIIHARGNDRFRNQVRLAVREELIAHFTPRDFPSEIIVDWFQQNFEVFCAGEEALVADAIAKRIDEHNQGKWFFSFLVFSFFFHC